MRTDVRMGLPTTLNTVDAAKLFGVSKWALYNAKRDGDSPVEPIRVGRALRWPTALILDKLGIDPEAAVRLLDLDSPGR